MVKKFDLIAGDPNEVKAYIENLENFHMWQIGKSYYDQVKRLLDRDVVFKHIGVVTYQGKTDEGVTIHAAFIAIEFPNRFPND